MAILCCSDADGFLALFLSPSPGPKLDPPTYNIGQIPVGSGTGGSSQAARIITLGRNLSALRFAGGRVTFFWKAICLQ